MYDFIYIFVFCSFCYVCILFFFFFFQAEDGIRDPLVTGVQTCALPISAQFCRPTARGLAQALGLEEPHGLEAEAASLPAAAEALLVELTAGRDPDPDALATARAMTRGGWLWGPVVLAVLGDDPQAFEQHRSTAALEPWR